jgi:hypothetical protein
MSLNRSISFAIGVGLTFLSLTARADKASEKKALEEKKQVCVAQLDKAQSLQSSHKLVEARETYLACSTDACPDLVREDCAKTLASLDGTMPSAVFSAQAESGEVTDVRVLVDGHLVSEKIDGKALVLNPGEHTARFIKVGRLPVEVSFVAREGEKNHSVLASFGTPPKPETAKKLEGGKHVPILPIILGGVGLAAVGGGFAFRLSADADARDLRDSCAPACSGSSRDSLSNKLVMSNVSFVAGGVLLAASAIAWIVDSNR